MSDSFAVLLTVIITLGVVVILVASMSAIRPFLGKLVQPAPAPPMPDPPSPVQAKKDETTSDLLTTIRALTDTTRDLSQRLNSLEGDVAIYRGEIRNLEDHQHRSDRLIVELGHGVEILTNQVIRLGDEPDWVLSDYAQEWLNKKSAKKDNQEDPVILTYKNLGEYFNEDELREICMDLGINYEDLHGGMRRAKAQSLVVLMDSHQRLTELIQIGKRERPLLDWPEVR